MTRRNKEQAIDEGVVPIIIFRSIIIFYYTGYKIDR